MIRIRLLVEVPNPTPGFGPLLKGDYHAVIQDNLTATIGQFVIQPDQYLIIDAHPGHPFRPAGWKKILDGIYRHQKEPGWAACQGSAKKAVG